jgi:ATP-dependent Clp protease ATP-binding subunit ClpC
VGAARRAAERELDADDPIGQPANLTPRTRQALRLAVEAARAAGSPEGGPAPRVSGMVREGSNLALLVLGAMEIDPQQVVDALGGPATAGATGQAGADRPGRRFDRAAASALERSVVEALTLGHNYVGCEHLLIGLVEEPDGAGGRALRAAGAEARATRRSVVAALSGYTHLRAQAAGRPAADALTTAIQRELQPITSRLDRLEQRLTALAATPGEG